MANLSLQFHILTRTVAITNDFITMCAVIKEELWIPDDCNEEVEDILFGHSKKETVPMHKVIMPCIKTEPVDDSDVQTEPTIYSLPIAIKEEPMDIKEEPMDELYAEENTLLNNNNCHIIDNLDLQVKETLVIKKEPKIEFDVDRLLINTNDPNIDDRDLKAQEILDIKTEVNDNSDLKDKKKSVRPRAAPKKKLKKCVDSEQRQLTENETYKIENEKLLKTAIARCSDKECGTETKVVRRQTKCLVCQKQLLYVCELCEKPLKSCANLVLHLRTIHITNAKIYACELCSGRFAHIKRLNYHRKSKHGLRVKSKLE